MRPEAAQAPAAAAEAPSRARLIAAFAAVYVIWGSTYLAIAIAIRTMPPFFMAGVRFLIAGAFLYGWLRLRGAPRPSRANWLAAGIVGGLLLLGGNGAVVWAEQRVPSGIAALIVATLPVWMVLIDWLRPGGSRPGPLVLAGLVLGLSGVGVLIGPSSITGNSGVDVLGAGVLMFGSICWASGSLYSRQAPLPHSASLGMAMQMLLGGALLIFAGLITGESQHLEISRISGASLGALAYLVAFGSLVGYTAYMWLLRVASPARVSTYAYVNPVIAVLLGWLVLAEPVTSRSMLAAVIIVGAVALIVSARTPTPRNAPVSRITDHAGRRDAA